MPHPVVLITGFGPFPGVSENPSLAVARALEAQPPAGVRVVARELPVTFADAPLAVRSGLAELEREGDEPVLLLGLGVQPEAAFRLERRARGKLSGGREDNAGCTASTVGVDAGADLETTLDLARLERMLRAAGAAGAAAITLSGDAGGYVCERTYHELLTCARERGLAALFLHVPPVEALSPTAQTPIVRALVADLVAQVSSSSRGRSSAD